MQKKWGVAYDMRLVVKGKRLYLHIMWGYLGQQSFRMDEEAFRNHLAEVIEVINRLGLSAEVFEWLKNVSQKPRLGKALTFHLNGDQRIQEFLL